MDTFRVAILGCGTVGGGVAKILLELQDELLVRAGKKIEIAKILDIFPESASEKHNIPRSLFCGKSSEITKDDANRYIKEIVDDKNIDLVVETIGGSSQYILDIVLSVQKSKKHLVTANKALLAKYSDVIFSTAEENNVSIGFEASVCGAIPIIKAIKECFTGDDIISISGIMNGTSNYILSKMKTEGLGFEEALKLAQECGYAEADPTLDINGGDAGHKLTILLKLAFGLNIDFEQLSVAGIQNIKKEDHNFATELDATIKLICFAKRIDGKVYASVQPMMVKNHNFLSGINGATNAVKLLNKYSNEHILVGKGAGSLETGSAIVSDIVFISKYSNAMINSTSKNKYSLAKQNEVEFPYIIIFETEDTPGITGAITTAIGNCNINIDTVGHNRHSKSKAIFTVATMPCKMIQIENAIQDIKKNRPDILISNPKILPILN